jgi:magnesium-transporting ATPase (P-type)
MKHINETIPHDWHHQSSQDVLETLATSSEGLIDSEVQERLEKYGLNCLPEAPRKSMLIRFLLHFHNILIYVLIGSSVITAFLGHWIDTGVILAVVILNALMGFVQEGKAEKAMEAIRDMLAPRAQVIRNGERLSTPGEEIVIGDLVILEAGDKVPADLRLIAANGLSIQEAILTGESVPVEKQTKAVSLNSSLGERTCMAFSGTLVTSGQGKGIVVAIADKTEIGRISDMLSEVETLTTPLVEQMATFARWLTLFILLVAACLLLYTFWSDTYEFSEMFVSVVGLVVAAIPEGLPAVLTITLAIGVQNMAKRSAIVRRLPAIETLGSVSVICSDKTGTLTRNEMMVASVVTHKDLYSVDGVGYTPKGDFKLEDSPVSANEDFILGELARAATLCNDASLRELEDSWIVEGDPMEGALLSFAGKVDGDHRQENSTWTRTDEIPFDSKSRFMATLNHHHEHNALIIVKGAPEKILEMCAQERRAGETSGPLQIDYWSQKIEMIATQGHRVLAFAARSIDSKQTTLEHTDVDGSLIFLGMVGMIDPPREEVISAIQECHGAGIKVKMITGDHAKTAVAIGKKIGLSNFDKVLTGKDLNLMDDNALKSAVMDCDIFARTSPEDKLRLVTALQSHDMTVAMTGDGVNDAPALKRADAGIAMGLKGSQAAKEAADLVLADDNFASIVAAVREGRTVYDNIKKVISWTLPTSSGEAMTIVVALLLGMNLPITAIQILWINLITAITLGIALAFEPTEENTMFRAPRPRNEPILTKDLVWHIILVSFLILAGVFGIFNYAIQRGYSVELARTMALNCLVVMEIFHLFFIRNIYGRSLTWKAVKGTKTIWTVVVAITIAQFGITYLPPLQTIFETRAIAFWDGLLLVGVGVALFIVLEIEKQIRLWRSSVSSNDDKLLRV